MIYVSEDIWDFDLDAALMQVSVQRREQALKFRHEEGRRLCVLAYRLLQQGLLEEYGITAPPVFEYNEHGKPSIIGRPDIFFSLSHCKAAAACALSDKPIGIDVETIRPFRASLARYAMSDDELKHIQSADRPDVAFIRLWTMKEATFKLVGTGIGNGLKTVIDTSRYRYTTVERQRYIYTVCDMVKLIQSVGFIK